MLRRPLTTIIVLAVTVAGCGGEEPDPMQAQVNEGILAGLIARGVPADVAGCLTEKLEQEFPIERIEELTAGAQKDPFAAFGPDEQASVLRISEACGGPAALFGGGPGGGVAATPDPAPTGADAYFDCVADAASSAEVKRCEDRLGG